MYEKHMSTETLSLNAPKLAAVPENDVPLRDYMEMKVSELELRMHERIESLRREIEAAFKSATVAVDKADMANQRRFEAVNEFRGQLSDQAARFVTRDELTVVEQKLAALIERNRTDVETLAQRMS